MTRKNLSQEIVESRFIESNLILLEKYNGAKYKYKTQCKCGKIFNVKAYRVFTKHTQSCGCKKYEFKNSINDFIGKQFNKLTIIECTNTYKGKQTKHNLLYKCICECGKYKIIKLHSLLCSHIKSCGCSKIDNFTKEGLSLINQRFGKLTVIKYLGLRKYINGKNYSYVKCKCDCGKNYICRIKMLKQGRNTTCTKCTNIINGVKTSNISLKLHDLFITNNYNTNKKLHNYKTRIGICVDIAIRINKLKIAVEYDGGFFHRKKLSKDKIKIKNLIKNGWKVLIIRSNNKLPKISTIIKRINKLLNGSNKEIIILSDWYLVSRNKCIGK